MIQTSKTQNEKKYDLGERTFEFSKRLIKFLKTLPREPQTQAIVLQAIRSGTSIGANYREANGAESKKDFLHQKWKTELVDKRVQGVREDFWED